ncbi:hypothetical protein [Flavobacterium psychrotolerans]|uniref:Lysine transporter LysE n=1 Tax=Flavobacterium psychrotolerans TaxID=2169410 RepID=A0A2U1JHI0_9FLAO|nr:hypothetical protein [Flavobacterium psychrotolerans]PWA04464.1 hypothetical protein DB895_11140 [Flavobacterium psychrotolerans]
MDGVKNILVGFLVSFVGSIPLGYLNVIGLQIYNKLGINNVILYLFGVISIEVFVVYFTLIFAERLSNERKLIKIIDGFSIFFMLLLAYSFYSQSHMGTSSPVMTTKYLDHSPYLIGVIWSSFNFIQIPFWIGWNLYLTHAQFISVEKKYKLLYVLGTLIGTFLGMLALILGLNLVVQNSEKISKYLFSTLIPLFFLAMAFFQTFKFYKKYFNIKN